MNTLALRAISLPLAYLPRSGPLVRRLAPESGPVVRRRFRGGAEFNLDLSDRMQAEAFVRRAYEPAVCRWMSRHLAPGDLFVDVGANIGLLSFTAARMGARVAAFEADPANCQRWLANQELNPGDVRLIEAAVGDRAGVTRFSSGDESGWGHVDAHGEYEVRQVALDDEFPSERIAALKIDVEGHEPAVLRGAGRLLAEQRASAIVCEMNDGYPGGRERDPAATR